MDTRKTNIAAFFFLSITLLFSAYTIGYPAQSFAALDVTGKWDGTINFTVSFVNWDGNKVVCQFTGTASATISQSGSTLSGSVSGVANGKSGNHEDCNAEYAGSYNEPINGNLFGSSFSGTIGPGAFRGSFTSDTFFGTYSLGNELSGSITLNKLGFKPQPPKNDSDRDGIPDDKDNCLNNSNADQINSDNDRLGDACDPDDDNDGILDRYDKCRTLAETKNGYLDNDGCPEDESLIDRDGDLVPDIRDKCPTDPKKIEPGVSGCNKPEDRDRDNIPDDYDACPDDYGTDFDGCPKLGEKKVDEKTNGFEECEYDYGPDVVGCPDPGGPIDSDNDKDSPLFDPNKKDDLNRYLKSYVGPTTSEKISSWIDKHYMPSDNWKEKLNEQQEKSKIEKNLVKETQGQYPPLPKMGELHSKDDVLLLELARQGSNYIYGPKSHAGSILHAGDIVAVNKNAKNPVTIDWGGDKVTIKPGSIVLIGEPEQLRDYAKATGDPHYVALVEGSVRIYEIYKTDEWSKDSPKVDAIFPFAVGKSPVVVGGTDVTIKHNIITERSSIRIDDGWVKVFDAASNEMKRYEAGTTLVTNNDGYFVDQVSSQKIDDKEFDNGFIDEPFHGDTPDNDDGYEDEYDYDFYEYEDPENIEYGFQDPRNYNVGIEIPAHWNLFTVATDKTEFPARTYYSMWYNTWMNWIELSLFHDIGQKVDLQNLDDIIDNYEDYKRQWCEVTKENPVFLDEPDDSGWQTCLELKDFDFDKITIDGIDAVQVSYLMSEKFEFEDYPDETEFETWAFWENLIPYDNDLIVVTGETLSKNVGKQRTIILDSINSFKILNYDKPVFLEPSISSRDESPFNRPLKPTNIESLSIPQPEPVDKIPTKVSKQLDLNLDYTQMQLKRYEPIQLTISGELDDYTRGARILFSITDPNGETTEQSVIATKDGKYENYLWFGKGTIHGEYKIKSQFRGQESKMLSFNLLPPYKEMTLVKEKMTPKQPVPEWIKENVKWWVDGAIGDDSFKQGISFMIKEDIISIEDLPAASGASEDMIPDWIKQNAKWWTDGLLTEDDFVNGLKYMVEKGIIGVN